MQKMNVDTGYEKKTKAKTALERLENGFVDVANDEVRLEEVSLENQVKVYQ